MFLATSNEKLYIHFLIYIKFIFSHNISVKQAFYTFVKALMSEFSEDFFRQINALKESLCWYKYKNNADKINIYNVTIVKAQMVVFDSALMHKFTTPVMTLAAAKNRSPL